MRDLGRKQADDWLQRHWNDLGERSSFDLNWLLEDGIKPVGSGREHCA